MKSFNSSLSFLKIHVIPIKNLKNSIVISRNSRKPLQLWSKPKKEIKHKNLKTTEALYKLVLTFASKYRKCQLKKQQTGGSGNHFLFFMCQNMFPSKRVRMLETEEEILQLPEDR